MITNPRETTSRLEAEAKKGNKTSKQILKTAENPDRFLSTVQIAITAVGLITGMYSGESLIKPLGVFISSIGLNEYYSKIVARIIIVISTTLRVRLQDVIITQHTERVLVLIVVGN